MITLVCIGYACLTIWKCVYKQRDISGFYFRCAYYTVLIWGP